MFHKGIFKIDKGFLNFWTFFNFFTCQLTFPKVILLGCDNLWDWSQERGLYYLSDPSYISRSQKLAHEATEFGQ